MARFFAFPLLAFALLSTTPSFADDRVTDTELRAAYYLGVATEQLDRTKSIRS